MVATPASIRDRSRRFATSRVRRSVSSSIVSRNSRRCAESQLTAASSSRRLLIDPLIAASGVRSSYFPKIKYANDGGSRRLAPVALAFARKARMDEAFGRAVRPGLRRPGTNSSAIASPSGGEAPQCRYHAGVGLRQPHIAPRAPSRAPQRDPTATQEERLLDGANVRWVRVVRLHRQPRIMTDRVLPPLP